MSPVILTKLKTSFFQNEIQAENETSSFSPRFHFEKPLDRSRFQSLIFPTRLAQTMRRSVSSQTVPQSFLSEDERCLKKIIPRHLLNRNEMTALLHFTRLAFAQNFSESSIDSCSALELRDRVSVLAIEISNRFPSLATRAQRLIFTLLLHCNENSQNHLLANRRTYLCLNIEALQSSENIFENTAHLNQVLNRQTKILETAALLGIEDLLDFNSPLERRAEQLFESTLSYWRSANSGTNGASNPSFPFTTTDPNVVPLGSSNFEYLVNQQNYSELPFDVQQIFRQQALLGQNVVTWRNSSGRMREADHLSSLLAYEFFVISHPGQRRMEEHLRDKYVYLAREFLRRL